LRRVTPVMRDRRHRYAGNNSGSEKESKLHCDPLC
jgi:hypothetical protein